MHVFLGDKTSSGPTTSLTQDELNELHRKERKELQSKIQSLKKTITKGDKKRKKEISAEIEKLEAEFEEKCQIELRMCAQNNPSSVKSELPKPLDEELDEIEDSSPKVEGANKVSKAKKRREKKRKRKHCTRSRDCQAGD